MMGSSGYRHAQCMTWILYGVWIIELAALVVAAQCQDPYTETGLIKVVPSSNDGQTKPYMPVSQTITFTWRQQNLVLHLHSHKISPDGAVVEWFQDGSVAEAEVVQDETIHYQGNVVGHAHSYAALEYNAKEFTGYIQLDDEGIFIEPLATGNSSTTHSTGHLLRACGKEPTPKTPKPRAPVTFHIPNHRQKRAVPSQFTKYLEVLFVADTTVVKFVGKDKVKAYIMGLMNIVNTIYHDHTLGVNIEVVTVKILFMDGASERKVVTVSEPQRTVDEFCKWVSQQTYMGHHRGTGTGSHHDVAVLLSRSKFGPAGYAPITGMCMPMRSCALVKDDGFTSAFVIAHEVAHIFGLMHDGHGNSCYGREYSASIMATIVQSSFNHYWWSSCSKARMAEVIDHLHCLNNNPYTVVKEDLKLPLGLSYSLDEQCRFEFGGTSTFCRSFSRMDPCSQLWCDDGTRRHSCKTKNVVPLEGTQCGPTSQWYCKTGQCGYHGNRAAVHGGWSQWSAWSNCSVQCDIGFKRRSRHCNNPVPQYGGNVCDGVSENTDTCVAEECTNYVDQRAYQCDVMSGIPVSGRMQTWLSYQTAKVADECKLTCVSKESHQVVTFDVIVDNGTPCSYEKPHFICMDGKCEKVGCDGVRGSDAIPDKCGVCKGDGTTCKVVSGIYSRKFEYSAAGRGHYETALVLPKGARNINITEVGALPHFLSLQDTVYYNQVLNGNEQEGISRNFAMEGAWFYYTNQHGHETLGTKGPVRRNINLKIYPMAYNVPAEFAYSYLVDKNDYTLEKTRYKWKFQDWSPCSVTCGKGRVHIVYACYTRDSEERVDDDKCKHIDSNEVEDVECTMIHCQSLLYNWRMLKTFSECSASCGDSGVYHRHFECERLQTNEAVGHAFCSHAPEPIDKQPCNRITCETIQYAWKTTTHWTSCSATCGTNGSQRQLRLCMRQINKMDAEEVDEQHCSDLKISVKTRPCNRLPCVTYNWKTTDKWQVCNASCGQYGVQNKMAVCKKFIGDESYSTVGLWYCARKPKPKDIRDCNRRACFTLQWSLTGQWTDCNKTCGSDGFMKQLVTCVNVTYDDRQNKIPDKYCADHVKPVVVAACHLPACASEYQWEETSVWSDCSVTCSEGMQTMQGKCVEVVGDNTHAVADIKCEHANVVRETRTCDAGPCGFLEWGAGPWTSCSRTCGEGVRHRDVYCGQQDKQAAKTRCPGKSPHDKETCNQRECKADAKQTCKKDRAPFCARASKRFCSHAAYSRVCCKACDAFAYKVTSGSGQVKRSRLRRHHRTNVRRKA